MDEPMDPIEAVASHLRDLVVAEAKALMSLPSPLADAPGILAYDLEPPPPWPPGERVRFTPLGRAPVRMRYTPPPLLEGFVRVELHDYDEAGAHACPWAEPHTDRPWEVHDVPAGQWERWEAARIAHKAAQAEIEALMEARHREPGWPNVPPGWSERWAG